MKLKRPFGWIAWSLLVLSCTGDGLPPPDELESVPGALTGEVEVRIVDHFDGSSERRYRLQVNGQARSLPLAFTEDPALAPGTSIAVWGSSNDTGVSVQSWKTLRLPEEEPDLQVNQRALIGAPALPKRKVAFVLVDLGNGVNITAEQARTRAFSLMPGDQSMKHVAREYSFGRLDLEGDVLGPFKTTISGCDEDGVADRLKGMVPEGYDNIVWYFGQRVQACGWAGVAPLGRMGKPAGQLWVNGTASCRVATHEFGHNLGLQHAARVRCVGAPLVDDLSKCQASEYGDTADVMGDGCNHFNGYSKAYLGWLERCNGVIAKSSGSYTLLPVETACDGTQVLFIPMPKTRRIGSTELAYYALDLRTSIGLDSRFSSPTVMVRLAAQVVQSRGARMTYILDTNPTTTALDGLKPGESITDPMGGLSFSVESASATAAVIKVTVPEGMAGATTCLDGTVFTPPGPLTCANLAGTPTPPIDLPPADAGVADAGAADAGGSGGRAGSGGSPGSGGAGGGAGSDGSGGANATGGTGGADKPGGGSGGATGGKPSTPSAPPAESGCGCDLGGRAPNGPAGVLALGAVLGLLARRRRR
jgi:MYXO-CTERM domain-containing protein